MDIVCQRVSAIKHITGNYYFDAMPKVHGFALNEVRNMLLDVDYGSGDCDPYSEIKWHSASYK